MLKQNLMSNGLESTIHENISLVLGVWYKGHSDLQNDFNRMHKNKLSIIAWILSKVTI